MSIQAYFLLCLRTFSILAAISSSTSPAAINSLVFAAGAGSVVVAGGCCALLGSVSCMVSSDVLPFWSTMLTLAVSGVLVAMRLGAMLYVLVDSGRVFSWLVIVVWFTVLPFWSVIFRVKLGVLIPLPWLVTFTLKTPYFCVASADVP